ncbi:MAG: hypothetical protein HY289_09790 [Planctomycetes bacterium]|nr:hypothetical protein [Planctomycetota bacterium]
MDTSVYLLRPAFEGLQLHTLSTNDFAQACRLFMELAYADAPDLIPENKRPYCDIPSDGSMADYLPPAPLAAGICQDLSKGKSGVPGYEFRLGSSGHAHLKLRIQQMPLHGRDIWVYSVDTHDRFFQATKHLNPDEGAAWRTMTEKNSRLKHQIEEALALAGFTTPISLLKVDLTSPTT